VHEDSVCSGVYYSRAGGSNGVSLTPLVFSDPRGGGGQAVNPKIVQDFEPAAPFHHTYSFFPFDGAVVLFPSYAVHQIHAHKEVRRTSQGGSEEGLRIVWAFNLYCDFDAWARSNG
jgi:hypothetical protein